MRRALQLAANGLGTVSPNPMVGCVIVHNDRIIGEGWHQKYGEAHAEVNAIRSVKDRSLLPACTLYVTLEPCAHHGKTPPCADLVAEHRIPAVVIANRDPFGLVDGKGIARLKAADISVTTGVLEADGAFLNRRFFTFHQKRRPYIILKWAQTADGFIARKNYDSKWISNSISRKLVHKWRTEEDSILVGMNTAKYDNPRLNARDWEGSSPTRMVIDRDLDLDVNEDLHLFDGKLPTLYLNGRKSGTVDGMEYVRLPFERLEQEITEELYRRDILSVIIEGGAQVLNNFIRQGLWDEARVFTSATRFGTGIEAPGLPKPVHERLDLAGDELSVCFNI